MKKVVVSEFMDDSGLAYLRERCVVDYDATLVERPAELAKALADAQALIVRNRTQVTPALLAQGPQLRAIGRLGVGLDNIDLAACAAARAEVFPAIGANARAVAEYVIAATLLLLRGAYLSSAEVAGGAWPRTALSGGREAAGSVLAVIGMGGIGQLTAQLARGLGMEVLGCDPLQPEGAPCWRASGARRVELDEALALADALTLHVPLIDATRNLLDARRIAAMKPGAVVINTARGGIVDEAALAEALRQGRLGGAALDVFADEPLRSGSPLADAPRLLLTPHIAGLSAQSNERVSLVVAHAVARHLALPT